MDKRVLFDLCYGKLKRCVESPAGRRHVTIDVDATDDPIHVRQQMIMFHGFYRRFIYSELFSNDGDTGQIIVLVLRPGNSHSNGWYAEILNG